MCYLVTAIRGSNRVHVIFDTEKEARDHSVTLLDSDYNEIAIWKQIATPKLIKTISWEESSDATA